MTTATAAPHLATLSFVRNWLEQAFASIPRDKMLHQPVPDANHALWLMGHLAWCDDLFMNKLNGRPRSTPAEWKELFGDGSKPMADASRYPAVETVQRAFTECREAAMAWLGSLDAAALAAPLPDDWLEFAPNYGAFITMMAMHESVHLGQLTVVRKDLGLAPVMM